MQWCFFALAIGLISLSEIRSEIQITSNKKVFKPGNISDQAFNESSEYVKFICHAKVPVRWKVSGLLVTVSEGTNKTRTFFCLFKTKYLFLQNSSRIEVAIEWQKSKEMYRSSLGVVLEHKLTGYISCEAASGNDRKKYQPAIIYVYIKGKYNDYNECSYN